MARTVSRTRVRSAKTGRFVKKSAAKYRPSTTIVETPKKSSQTVTVVRSAKTGRFVKKSAAKYRPKTTVTVKLKR